MTMFFPCLQASIPLSLRNGEGELLIPFANPYLQVGAIAPSTPLPPAPPPVLSCFPKPVEQKPQVHVLVVHEGYIYILLCTQRSSDQVRSLNPTRPDPASRACSGRANDRKSRPNFRRSTAGWGSWGGGSKPFPHQLGGLESAVSSPNGV